MKGKMTALWLLTLLAVSGCAAKGYDAGGQESFKAEDVKEMRVEKKSMPEKGDSDSLAFSENTMFTLRIYEPWIYESLHYTLQSDGTLIVLYHSTELGREKLSPEKMEEIKVFFSQEKVYSMDVGKEDDVTDGVSRYIVLYDSDGNEIEIGGYELRGGDHFNAYFDKLYELVQDDYTKQWSDKLDECVRDGVSFAERYLNVKQEKSIADPMLPETPYQRAAYFADWAYLQKKENTMISPLSLNMALGLAAEGASGETAREIYDYLGREDYAEYVKKYLTYAEGLACEKGEKQFQGDYSFHYEIANSLWINQKNRIREEYRKSVTDAFRAEVLPADFERDVAGTVEKINDWCSNKTHDMIRKIIEERDVEPNTKAILINSLYFESPWVNSWVLKKHDFTDFAGNKTTQEMLVSGADAYYENEKATAFGKNYFNGFRFIGILPKTEGEFNVLDLDLEGLLASQNMDFEVSAMMPKLNFETSAENVQDLLIAEGITAPFDPSISGFDKIIEGDSLFVDSILQKCKIELDENGTKAAAITAVTLRYNAIEPMLKERKEVYLDRPFAFLIYDEVNDEILFVGKVTTVN